MSGAIHGVRSQIEDESIFAARDRPAADRRRFLEKDDGHAGPRDERRGNQPRQSTTNDDDRRLMTED